MFKGFILSLVESDVKHSYEIESLHYTYILLVATSICLKAGQTIAPFLVKTSSGAKCVVVINATDKPGIPKLKDTTSTDGILLRNKDVFLPQIVDDNGDDEIGTGTKL